METKCKNEKQTISTLIGCYRNNEQCRNVNVQQRKWAWLVNPLSVCRIRIGGQMKTVDLTYRCVCACAILKRWNITFPEIMLCHAIVECIGQNEHKHIRHLYLRIGQNSRAALILHRLTSIAEKRNSINYQMDGVGTTQTAWKHHSEPNTNDLTTINKIHTDTCTHIYSPYRIKILCFGQDDNVRCRFAWDNKRVNTSNFYKENFVL